MPEHLYYHLGTRAILEFDSKPVVGAVLLKLSKCGQSVSAESETVHTLLLNVLAPSLRALVRTRFRCAGACAEEPGQGHWCGMQGSASEFQ